MRFQLIAATFLLVLPSWGQSATQWPPELTEEWEPVPSVVTPGLGTLPPSDAIVLLGAGGLAEWESNDGGPADWLVDGDVMTVCAGAGDIRTLRSFGSVQLHLEWRTPAEVVGQGQGRGNSGVFLQDRYEVQVLDSFENQTYPNGQAGAVYKQHIPLVNASRAPGEWQSYDIIFQAPMFDETGELVRPAAATVFHNGVLILYHAILRGPTVFRGLPRYEAHGPAPLKLQDHGNPVSYRNIWIREL